MDARLTLLTLRALLRSRGHSFPQDLCKMDFIPRDGSALMVSSEIPTPVELYESARMTEDVLTQALNRLTVLPQEVDGLRTRLETLRHFSAVDVYVKGELLRERIMFMFDDADALAQRQRDALRHDLEHRDLEVGRWIALRLQALSMSELLSYGRTEGRDFSMVRIEEWAKQNRGTVFSHLLDEVANRRVSQAQGWRQQLCICSRWSSGGRKGRTLSFGERSRDSLSCGGVNPNYSKDGSTLWRVTDHP